MDKDALTSMVLEQGKKIESLFSTPSDVHSQSAWDEYWLRTLKSEFGSMIVGFGDMMSSDRRLLKVLSQRQVRTVLCVGNGLSSEATALALHGFDVTALDISAIPEQFFDGILANDAHRLRGIPGTTVETGKTLRFGVSDALDSDFCPPIHRDSDMPPRGGGALRHVTADLMDESSCSGPYDCVIERRTVQLFAEAERPTVLDRLTARLQTPGLLVSHHHNGAWRPGQSRSHWAATLIGDRGFTREPESASKLAHLIYTSG
jgi:hypothetical protein